MNTIKINEEKCIGCSLCIKDCPNSYLYLENKKAHTNGTGCMHRALFGKRDCQVFQKKAGDLEIGR